MSKLNTGALFSPKDLRDYKANMRVSGIQLPEEYSVHTSDIKNQGNVNSCVAHALSSLLENKYKKHYSTGFIYGYRPSNYYQGEGMYPRQALKTLYNVGDVEHYHFPENVEMPKAKTLVERNQDLLITQAKDNKITGYARLNTDQEIKTWIYTKNIPVPIVIATEDITLSSDDIIEIPTKYPNAGHMILIVGWNATGYIIQNSWGDKWGNNGTAILPYEYRVEEAWGVTLDEKQAKTSLEKPKFNFLRVILMKIYTFIGKTIKN